MGTVRIASSQVSPATTFYLEADHVETDTKNRRWRVRFYLRAVNGPGGSTASRYEGSGVQIGRVRGSEFRRHAATPFLPGGYQNGATRWNDGPWDVWVNANAAGWVSGTSARLDLQMQLAYGNVNTTPTGFINLPRIGTVPPAPTPLPTTPDQITATTMRYQFSGNGDGGNAIIRWEYRYSTSPTFASGNSAWIASSGTSIISGLTPNTTYYLQSRGVNSFGNGAVSATRSGKTLVGDTPGMLVVPSLDGTKATVTLTPPPTIPSPTGYRLEYRLLGTTNATAIDTGASTTVAPLNPGATYQWRAAAKVGTYTGPFTAWTSVVQPNTNTNPGDYFDGATAARADLTFAWNGTVNNSTSRAIGKAVLGWGNFASGSSVSGGTGTVSRVTGGRSQQFAARVEFWTPTTAAGFHAGTGTAAGQTFPALQDATYAGLAHVRLPDRGQRLAAMFLWLNGAGTEVGRSIGTAVDVGASAEVWTPLRVIGTPPPGAVAGAVRVIDVAGVGWSVWNSGDRLLIDDVITPFGDFYFDGSTPDTAEWLFSWDGTANGSASRAVANTAAPPNPLLDPDCPPVPAPPRPPDVNNICVEDDVTEWRRFWQEIPALYVPTWVDTVPILKVETTTAVRLVRVRYYPNPFGRSLDQLERDGYCSEQIISYIPGDTIFTLDGVSQRAFAEVTGSAATLSADHLLQGNNNLWPVLGCGIDYYVSVDVPTDTPANALTMGYTLVQRYA